MMSGGMGPIVIVSNRGPVSYRRDDEGGLTARRGAGGLVTGLAPLVAGTEATWIASALSDADRDASAAGLTEAEGFRVQLLAHDPDVLAMAYDVVGNAVLWFVHHGLFELARRPRYDQNFRAAWTAYQTYNATFANAVANGSPEHAVVLVQDYHLALMAPLVARRRPDLTLVHFSHTPFAGPELLAVLPDPYRSEVLEGMAANGACGFHTDRWRKRFLASCDEFDVTPPHTFVGSLAPDPNDLAAAASSDACRSWQDWIDKTFPEQQLVVRVDRIELSKNILRGFLAFAELLERWPQWRGRVSFLASVYPSREGLAEYLAYRHEVEHLVSRINDRWAAPGWQPILLATEDDFARSIAMLTRYDVLLVNPVRDGMNLVAKEGPQVNGRSGSLILSTETGAWDELGAEAIGVHPCDISATAEALELALSQARPARRDQALRLAELASRRTPRHWLDDQLAAATAATRS